MQLVTKTGVPPSDHHLLGHWSVQVQQVDQWRAGLDGGGLDRLLIGNAMDFETNKNIAMLIL